MDYIKKIRSKVGHDQIILNFAGGCVKNEKGQILLHKRKDNKKWSFPGGAIELGESAEEAALREIQEETGYQVKTTDLIGIYTKYTDKYANGDRAQTILFFFECEIINNTNQYDKQETMELAFFDLDTIPELMNQQHQDCLHDYINGVFPVCR
ncbi:NUDIX hydrolase [Alkalihalobacillus pseudalcaliphilus]|uniref:NUDIX hydrolase n=1 Tax=Alkalihalobacillus pseudalcaliphilus TaxID=79884 RepID=UPI00064DE3BF|nr:NUDIX domain-containing protein [Alkalihalobacillus pseudalcaliphilus]KMK77023.1 NTP pyrophosphohydrolase [Alkalihalobacillus pseudalcaliphilus]